MYTDDIRTWSLWVPMEQASFTKPNIVGLGATFRSPPYWSQLRGG